MIENNIGFFKKCVLLWFPSKEIRQKIKLVKSDYENRLLPHNQALFSNQEKHGDIKRQMASVQSDFTALENRLDTLKNCFEYKTSLYAEKETLHADKKSLFEDKDSVYEDIENIKRKIAEEYETLNEYHAKKDEFLEWSKRKPHISNLYYGKGGQKIRNHSVIWRNKGELDHFFSKINNAKDNITQLKSERSDAFEQINDIKNEIGKKNDAIMETRDAIATTKKICAYVKTKKGKDEIKDLHNRIRKNRTEYTGLDGKQNDLEKKMDNIETTIKKTIDKQKQEIRTVKLSKPSQTVSPH